MWDENNHSHPPQGHFSSLRERPNGFAEASTIARGFVDCDYIRGIADGPFGGTPLAVGDQVTGETVSAPLSDHGGSWGGVRIRDYSLAQTAHILTKSNLWLPGEPGALDLKITSLDSVGSLGRYDLDITGRPPQGPFDKIEASLTATYPSLWNHSAKRETRLVCEPDSQLMVRPGLEAKAATVWATASRAHINRDFRFNSQPLAAAFTVRVTVGGRAWPNVIIRRHALRLRILYMGQLHARPAVLLVAFQSPTTWTRSCKYPISGFPPGPRLPHTDRRPAIHRRVDLQRVPRQRPHARLPRRRRPQPRRPGPPRNLRPPRLRRNHLPSRPPPIRQVVRRAVSARRQKTATGSGADNLVRRNSDGES